MQPLKISGYSFTIILAITILIAAMLAPRDVKRNEVQEYSIKVLLEQINIIRDLSYNVGYYRQCHDPRSYYCMHQVRQISDDIEKLIPLVQANDAMYPLMIDILTRQDIDRLDVQQLNSAAKLVQAYKQIVTPEAKRLGFENLDDFYMD